VVIEQSKKWHGSGHVSALEAISLGTISDIPNLRNIQALPCKTAKEMGKKWAKNMPSFLTSSQEKLPYPATLYGSLSYCPPKPEKVVQLRRQEVPRFFGDVQLFFLIPPNAGLLPLESLPSFMLTNPIASGF